MKKRGLSAVITTLLIILLVLVAVGIIWVVVRNVVQSGADTLDVSNKCISVDLSAVSVSPVSGEAGNYSVTLKRNAGGDAIAGIKVNIFNGTESSGIAEFGSALAELETESRTVAAGIDNANRLEFTAYFADASGNDQLCSQTREFSF